MIIATIGNTKLKLDSLKDAEALLDITNRATLIETDYDTDYRTFYYVAEGEKRLQVEIIEVSPLHTFEEHRELKTKKKEAQAAAAAAVAEAEAEAAT